MILNIMSIAYPNKYNRNITLYSEEYNVFYIGDEKRLRLCVDQDTCKWKLLRKGNNNKSIGASSVGEWLGIGYNTPKDTYYNTINPNEDLTEDELFRKNLYTSHGTKYESIGALCYNKITNNKCYNGYLWKFNNYTNPINSSDIFSDPEGKHLEESNSDILNSWEKYSCSPDRCLLFNEPIYEDNINGKTLTPNNYLKGCLEIKCPYNKMYDNIPKYHISQMQYQSMITDSPFVDYCAVSIDPNEDEIKEIFCARVYKSVPYIKWMMNIISKASNCLYNNIEPDWDKYYGNIPTCKIDIFYKGTNNYNITRKDIINEIYENTVKFGLENW
jgi:hypothetical protein